jgi:hypothetical protein
MVDGILEYWSYGIMGAEFWLFGKSKPNIPLFQHSIIPDPN